MAKIDLTGNAGWQSKTGDKLKSLQDGSYDYSEISLTAEKIDTSWIEPGTIAQVLEGHIQLISNGETLEYQKDQMIYLNQDSIDNLEITLKELTRLGIFKEKN